MHNDIVPSANTCNCNTYQNCRYDMGYLISHTMFNYIYSVGHSSVTHSVNMMFQQSSKSLIFAEFIVAGDYPNPFSTQKALVEQSVGGVLSHKW